MLTDSMFGNSSVEDVAASSGKSPGGRPSKAHRALRMVVRVISRSGIVDSVARYCVLACCRFSSESSPLRKTRSVIS